MDFTWHLAHPGVPANHRLAKVSYGGKHFAILHRHAYADNQVIEQCFKQGQYDMTGREHGAFIERLYQQIVASGRQPLIMDCGANIGASVLWYSARYPRAHILAIEPAPDNFALLRHNTAGLDVDAREAGIAASDGHASIFDPGSGGWAYQTTEGPVSGSSPVSMLAIDSLVRAKIEASYVPFILKIDVEGAEKTLFGGNASLLNQFPLIVIETHDWMLPGQHSSAEFFRFHADAGRELTLKHENIFSIAVDDSIRDILAKPPAKFIPADSPATPCPPKWQESLHASSEVAAHQDLDQPVHLR